MCRVETDMARQPRERPSAAKKSKSLTDKKHEEELLDEALEDTFPASDAVSLIEPAPGSREGNAKRKE